MPTAAPHPCTVPGCPNLATKARCDDHAYDTHRGSAHSRGYDRDWQAKRKLKLMLNYLCEDGTHCRHKPITKQVATEVHHIKPVRTHPHLRLDLANLMSLCKSCHSAITARENQ